MRRGTLIAVLTFAASVQSFATASFTEIAPLPGYTSTDISGMTRTGNYAWGRCTGVVSGHGISASFIWTPASGMQQYSGPGGVVLVSDNGTIVSADQYGNYVTPPNGSRSILRIHPEAISSDGLVVVGEIALNDSFNTVYPVAWINGTVSTLIPPKPGLFSFASDVSADGQTIIGDYNPKNSGRTSFLWTASGGVTLFPDLAPFTTGSPLSTSADGRTFLNNTQHSIWTSPTQMIKLRTTDDEFAYSIADDRSVILLELNYSSAPYYESGIVTTEGEFALRDYLVNHGAFTTALMSRLPIGLVSRDGSTIMGLALDAQGNHQLYRATIDPQPVGSEIASLSATPNPRVCGNPVNVRTILNGPAPAGGAKVFYSGLKLSFNSHQILGYQPGVLIKAGNTQGDDGANTDPVDGPGPSWGYVHASYGTAFEGMYNFVALWPAKILSVSVPSGSVTGGSNVTCTVRLNGAAGNLTNIVVKSSDPVTAFTPNTITVPGGQYSTTFNIATHPVTTSEQVTVSLTYLYATKTVTFTVNP